MACDSTSRGRRRTAETNKRARWVLALLIGTAGATLGCRNEESTSAPVLSEQEAEQQFKFAVLKQDWPKAWQVTGQVLNDHPQDVELHVKAARVAHQVGHRDQAADLLTQACQLEGFASEERVRQAVVGLIEVGRLFDAFDWMEKALAAQPDQHGTRRWLFDLLRGTDQFSRARPHGEALVRARQFDAKLLQAMLRDDHPSDDHSAITEMVKRNPDDRRPLLRVAGDAMRRGDDALAIETAESILKTHPEYVPAQALLAFTLARSGDLERAEQWISKASDQQRLSVPHIWLAIGELEQATSNNASARDAFLQAARINPNEPAAWQGLVDNRPKSSDAGREALPWDAIETRLDHLSSLDRDAVLFQRTGGISRKLAVGIAETLGQLGRLWEAEAWASLALTLPADENVDAESVRDRIVGELTAETPFQLPIEALE